MTKIEAATNEQIATIKKKLAENSTDPARKLVMFAIETATLESLIARISALQSEIVTWKETAEQRANDCVTYQTEIATLRGQPVEVGTWQTMVDALLRCDRFVRDMLEEHGQGSGTFDVICKALDAAGVPPTKDRASKGEV